MGMREKLIKILREPIFPHELADPTEAVADYLLDNDVVPVVRCKDCMHRYTASSGVIFCTQHITVSAEDDDFCSYGERREGE